jgi:hypothetical protein
MSEKPTALMEGWYLLTLHGMPPQLIGFVSGHARLAGHRRFIQTSRVLAITNDFLKAETLNTVYTLRRPLTDVRFDRAHPVHVALADLAVERLAGEHWNISRDTQVVRDGIPGYQAAILCMLDLLDQRDRERSDSITTPPHARS